MSVDLLVCIATAVEGERIERSLGGERGDVAGRSVAVVRTGVGPVNAAHATTLFLAREGAARVVACGVGGAYPEAGLAVGDVLCARSEVYGDLGAESPDGFLDFAALGFAPIALDVQLFPCAARVPFATCTTCTGTDATARDLRARTGAAVESMEGAAVVHVANRLGVPVGEIRGISNLVGVRDRARWRLKEAADAAQAALLRWIEEGFAC